MKKEVQDYIIKEKLFTKNDKLILAISGGSDSVCLMLVLLELGYSFDLAHCNFLLRGAESDNDERFVNELSTLYDLRIHVKSFNTREYSINNKISIQMAARDLRYEWFSKLIKEKKAKYILTAHNQNDLAESFLLNLIRGSGILGLRGIPSKNTNIVRPLLNINKKKILDYLNDNKQTYREDSSNRSSKYLRNKIRHTLLPLLEEINPSIISTLIKEIIIFKNASYILDNHIKDVTDNILIYKEGYYSINIPNLKKLSSVNIYLFEILKPFGFHDLDSIIGALESHPGKIFFSKKYKMIIDRREILIYKIEEESNLEILVYKDIKMLDFPNKLRMSIRMNNNCINKSKRIAQLDYEKLKFPLLLRKWRNGDKFKPLGMDKYKKLSDFFIDNKMSRLEKDNQWVLCSDKDIVWVLGRRIDNRYKVESQTKKLYIAEILL